MIQKQKPVQFKRCEINVLFEEEEIIVNKRQKRLLVVPENYQIERGSGFREVDEKDLLKLGYVKQSDSPTREEYEFEKTRADSAEDLYSELQTILSASSVMQQENEIRYLRDLLKKAEERNLRQCEKLAMAEQVIRELRLEIKNMISRENVKPFQ